MNNEYLAVKQFHEAFGHPVATLPTAMGLERAEARARWMREEIEEFITASLLSLEKGKGDVVGQADAMIDLIYFALGTLVEIGVPPDELFAIVQRANMAKLHSDGKPRFREDGKIIKPVGWQAPEPKLKAYIESLKSANGYTPPTDFGTYLLLAYEWTGPYCSKPAKPSWFIRAYRNRTSGGTPCEPHWERQQYNWDTGGYEWFEPVRWQELPSV